MRRSADRCASQRTSSAARSAEANCSALSSSRDIVTLVAPNSLRPHPDEPAGARALAGVSKDGEGKLDYPPLREELRKLVDWVANYTLSPRGMVLRMALRMGDLGPERERVAVRLAGPAPQRLTPARRRVLDALADGLLRTKS